MIDTHTHLYDRAFNVEGENAESPADAVRRALDAGIEKMILPGCTSADLPAMKLLRTQFPANVFMAAGLHPTELPEAGKVDAELAAIEAELILHNSEYVAVGEIGIDLYWDKSRQEEQFRVFKYQCCLASRFGLPVIIHCRDAFEQTIRALEELAAMGEAPGLRGVFHSFSGDATDVARILALGDFYFGINGTITYKKSTLPEILPVIPRDRLLLETDSPYLAPVPRRGRRNESAYLPYTAVKVADILGITIEELEALTTANALRLFYLVR